MSQVCSLALAPNVFVPHSKNRFNFRHKYPSSKAILHTCARLRELKYSFEKVTGARSYVYQGTQEHLNETSDWVNYMGTQRRFLFSGLESGKRYWIRVAAIGIEGQTVYSDPLSRLVQ